MYLLSDRFPRKLLSFEMLHQYKEEKFVYASLYCGLHNRYWIQHHSPSSSFQFAEQTNAWAAWKQSSLFNVACDALVSSTNVYVRGDAAFSVKSDCYLVSFLQSQQSSDI
jgi:hypothetical protein